MMKRIRGHPVRWIATDEIVRTPKLTRLPWLRRVHRVSGPQRMLRLSTVCGWSNKPHLVRQIARAVKTAVAQRLAAAHQSKTAGLKTIAVGLMWWSPCKVYAGRGKLDPTNPVAQRVSASRPGAVTCRAWPIVHQTAGQWRSRAKAVQSRSRVHRPVRGATRADGRFRSRFRSRPRHRPRSRC